jgi:hypothetical protein
MTFTIRDHLEHVAQAGASVYAAEQKFRSGEYAFETLEYAMKWQEQAIQRALDAIDAEHTIKVNLFGGEQSPESASEPLCDWTVLEGRCIQEGGRVALPGEVCQRCSAAFSDGYRRRGEDDARIANAWRKASQ